MVGADMCLAYWRTDEVVALVAAISIAWSFALLGVSAATFYFARRAWR